MPKCFYLDCDEIVEYFHCTEHAQALMDKALGKVCLVIGCDRPVHNKTRGECELHYKRMRMKGTYAASGKEFYSSRSPSIRDLEWAAGFLEGEGCFSRNKKVKNGVERVYETVSASQVHKEPVEKLREMFGGNLRLHKKKEPNHRPIWLWNTQGPRARGIMMTMFSLLSSRRQGQIKTSFAASLPTKEAQTRFHTAR